MSGGLRGAALVRDPGYVARLAVGRHPGAETQVGRKARAPAPQLVTKQGVDGHHPELEGMSEPEHGLSGRLHEGPLAGRLHEAAVRAHEEGGAEPQADGHPEEGPSALAVEHGLGRVAGVGHVVPAALQAAAHLSLGAGGPGEKQANSNESPGKGANGERSSGGHGRVPRVRYLLRPSPLRAMTGRMRPKPYRSSRPAAPRSSALAWIAAWTAAGSVMP